MSAECEKCGEHVLECGCGYQYFIGQDQPIFKREWGFHNLMVIAAFRYCLGRRSYIVGSCVDWLIINWKEIDSTSKNLIIKEINEAILGDEAGDACDINHWQQLLEYASKKDGMDQR